MEVTESDTPARAAQRAAETLLKQYLAKYANAAEIISVTKLCDLVGIEIRGKLPRMSLKAIDRNQLTGSDAHSAKLSFDSGRPVIEVMDSRAPIARISAAHELGHYLIHLRDGKLNNDSLRADSSPEEEVLSEYIGRLLLMPKTLFPAYHKKGSNYSVECLSAASRAQVIMYASAARMIDPDHSQNSVRGTIFWKLHPNKPTDLPVEERLTPFWHQCGEAFIPIRRCHAKRGSLVATLGGSEGDVHGESEEAVRVGSLTGRFRVDAYSWGSLRTGTRCVLSVFTAPQDNDADRD